MSELKFTEAEIKAAKRTKESILKGDASKELEAVYMAGEICMWDEMNSQANDPLETASSLPIGDINAPLIQSLESELIMYTNDILKDGVRGDNYTRLDNKIKRISSTLNVLNGR